jgi:hypothetical protein
MARSVVDSHREPGWWRFLLELLKHFFGRNGHREQGHCTPRHDGIGLVAEPSQPVVPPAIVHKLIALLQDRKTYAVLAGFTVHDFDLDADNPPRSIGYGTTDARGLFQIVYASADGSAERKLRLQIMDRQPRQIADIDRIVNPDQEPPLIIVIDAPAPVPPPSRTIEAVTKEIHLALPEELTPFLDEQNVQTLDLRRIGELVGLNVFPSLPSESTVITTPDAHADLSVLSPNIGLKQTLIRRGFDSITTVARITRQAFVSALSVDV